MCSISGFSFTPDTRVNGTAVARALLIAGAERGTHAAGFAYMSPEGKIVGRNRPVTPSAFVSSAAFNLPKRAHNVILHTRFATQGAKENLLNNHPVFAYRNTDQTAVAAVHNGMIYNDYELFRLTDYVRYAQVDSEIIPAYIAGMDPEKPYTYPFTQIKGSCATAFLDERTPNALHLVRAADSPMRIAVLNEAPVTRGGRPGVPASGLIFASTDRMLTAALGVLGLTLESKGVRHFFFEEGCYSDVVDGVWDLSAWRFEVPKSVWETSDYAFGMGYTGSNYKGSSRGKRSSVYRGPPPPPPTTRSSSIELSTRPGRSTLCLVVTRRISTPGPRATPRQSRITSGAAGARARP